MDPRAVCLTHPRLLKWCGCLNGLLEGPQTYVSKLQQKQLLERLEPEQFLPFLKEMELQITGQARQEGLELLIDTSGGGKNAGTLLIALLASDEGKDGEKLDGSLDLNCVSLSTQRQPTTRGSNRLSDLFMRWLSADAEQAQSWLMANLNHPQLRRAFGSMIQKNGNTS